MSRAQPLLQGSRVLVVGYVSRQNLVVDGSLSRRFPLPLPAVAPNVAG
jgi:hypothetical protein